MNQMKDYKLVIVENSNGQQEVMMQRITPFEEGEDLTSTKLEPEVFRVNDQLPRDVLGS